MNKILISASFLLISIFPLNIAQARNIKDIKWTFTTEQTMDIQCPSYQHAPLGCFIAPNNIYIRIDNPNKAIIIDIMLHEITHFLTQDTTLEQYKEVFGGNETYSFYREQVAGFFDIWFWGKTKYPNAKLDEKIVNFFKKII